MQITELLWRLFIILLPGVIATLMLRQITPYKKYSITQFAISSGVLGVGTFVIMELGVSIWYAVYSLFHCNYKVTWQLNLTIWENFFNGTNKIDAWEIFISYLLSIPIGLLFGFVYGKKLINRFFKFLKLTNRYGDDDVWSFYLNSPETVFVYVRDKSSNLTYYGRVRAYSDSEQKREILLTDVDVYWSPTAQLLYQTGSVYLELNSYDFFIEST